MIARREAEPAPASAVERVLRRARRNGTPFSLLRARLERPARAPGRDGGCPRALAQHLGALAVALSCRKADLIMRDGADGFLVLAAGASAAAGLIVAERILQALAAIARERGLDSGAVSMSIGVADLERCAGPTAENLIAAAGAALSEARAVAGRTGGLAIAPRRNGVAAPTAVDALDLRARLRALSADRDQPRGHA